MVFPDLYEAARVAGRSRGNYGLAKPLISKLENCLYAAMKLNCDQEHQGCQRSNVSKAMHSAFVGQFFFSDVARSAHDMLPGHSKPIPAEFLACIEHSLMKKLAGTELDNAWFYLGVYGTKSRTTVESSLQLFQQIDKIMIDIDRQQFVSMEVDLAVRRWEHSTEPGLLTCAKSKSFEKHDVPYKRGTQYHLLMTNDIGGYQANHSEMKAGAATSVRGAIRHINFYCTAVNQLVMDRRQRTFSGAFSSSAYVLRSIEDIVQDYYAGNRMNSAAYLKKKFKHEVEDVVARLQELNSRDVAFRFEVGVPVECAFGALLILEKRALDDEDFFLLRSRSYATRYQCLLQQLYQTILDCSQTNRITENLVVKMAVSEDLIRRGLGQNKFYCGLTDLRAILKKIGFFDSIKNVNLPTWKALTKSEGDMEVADNDYEAILKNICGFYQMPNHINVPKLVRLSFSLRTGMVSCTTQIQESVKLYERELLDVIKPSHMGQA
jgi:hypothetical protein